MSSSLKVVGGLAAGRCRSKYKSTRPFSCTPLMCSRLLAPDEIVFFDRHWHRIGFKKYLIEEVARITGIRVAFLDESRHLDGACTAEKMSWLSHRVTTRPEDLAYCMLGIFDINMPLLYGEGLKAFIRLQEEIIRNSNDQSIFCWTYNLDVPESWGSVLAPHPSTFSMCQSIRVRPEIPTNSMSNRQLTSYALTNAGLHISLPILPTWSYFLAVLDAHEGDPRNNVNYCVPLIGSLSGGLLERMHWPEKPLLVGSTASKQAERELYIRAKRTRSSPRQQRLSGVGPGTKEPNRASLLLTFKAVDAFRKVETYPTGMFSTATSVLRLDSGARILGGFTRFVRFDNDDVVILFIARRNGHYAPEGEGLNWYCRVMPSSWRFQTADLKEELRSHDEWFGDGTGGVPKSSLGRTSVSLWSIGQGGWNYGQLRLAFIDHSLDDAEDEDMRSDIATVHNDNR